MRSSLLERKNKIGKKYNKSMIAWFKHKNCYKKIKIREKMKKTNNNQLKKD
jgi:hypothetical protein